MAELLAIPFLLVWFFLFWFGLYVLVSRKSIRGIESPIEKLAVTYFFSYFWLGAVIAFVFKLSLYVDLPGELHTTPAYRKFFHGLRSSYFFHYYTLVKNYGLIDLIALSIVIAIFSFFLVKMGKLFGWKFLLGGLAISLVGWAVALF
jgi:hypothetical protein